MKKFSALVLVLTWSIFVLASEKIIPNAENVLSHKGVVTMNVPWVKDKGSKYDIHVNFHNDDVDKGIIIFLSDMACKRGAVTGQLKHTFFNTGERTIDFRPNQSKDFTLVCKVEGKVAGDFSITIAKVYENPSMDGKTPGKVLAANLAWKNADHQ